MLDYNKDKFQELLLNWVNKPEDPQNTIALAEAYYKVGQLAAAVSYYIKTYELLPDDATEDRYYCLMSIATCYSVAGHRWEGVIHHCRLAKAEQPDRPEAYWLLAVELSKKLINKGVPEQYEWCQVYENAKIGLLYAEGGFDRPVGKFYEGINSLRWIYLIGCMRLSKLQEAKKALKDIEFDKLTDYQKNDIYQICDTLQVRNPMIAKDSNSHSGEDLTIYQLNDKQPGIFVEIGFDNWLLNNNTKYLEDNGWEGIAIDSDQKKVQDYVVNRKSTALCLDLYKADYTSLIKETVGKEVTLLQVGDVNEDINNEVIYHLPLDEVKFKFILFRHNGNQAYSSNIERLLTPKGYQLIKKNIPINITDPYEDLYQLKA